MADPATPFRTTTPFADDDERPMLQVVVAGVLIAMVVFALISTAIVRLSFSDESWGFALAVGGFAGFWAGLFFGSAAGVIVFQRHLDAASAPTATGAVASDDVADTSDDVADDVADAADDEVSAPGRVSGLGATSARAPRTSARP